jgi:hypothetical protein
MLFCEKKFKVSGTSRTRMFATLQGDTVQKDEITKSEEKKTTTI